MSDQRMSFNRKQAERDEAAERGRQKATVHKAESAKVLTSDEVFTAAAELADEAYPGSARLRLAFRFGFTEEWNS